MCLTLNPKLTIPDNLIKVYKLCYESAAGRITSPYQGMTWDFNTKTLFQSSRGDKTEIIESEKLEGKIEHGFHVYTDVAHALQGHRKDTCVIEFNAKPDHWVAFGLNNSGTAGAVFTELEFSQFIKRRTN